MKIASVRGHFENTLLINNKKAPNFTKKKEWHIEHIKFSFVHIFNNLVNTSPQQIAWLSWDPLWP